jgi:hypothetical protein
MKVRDLSFVEDELIAGIEAFLPELSQFCAELQEKAVGLAAAQSAREEAKRTGTAGLAKVTKKGSTKPISPRLTQPKIPHLPEPERIRQATLITEVPGFINRTNVAEINRQRQEELNRQREETKKKYSEKLEFKFQQIKGGRDIDEVRQEVEEERMKEVKFDSSFVNEPPDFSKIPAKVRVNASTVYREDALFRKQQAKDAEVLKRYEEELRDGTEYILWQREMKEKDENIKDQNVLLRREQARLSAEEAREAMIKQKEDNKVVADLLRQQGEAIKQQKALESEISILKNQAAAQSIAEVRDTRPVEAKSRVFEERSNRAQALREELEQARLAKEQEERLEEERKADVIRQLKAENSVLKKTVKIFDPTQVAGIGLLDEMSYIEMKERLQTERQRAEREEEERRLRILDDKEKRAKDLENRSMALLKARESKAEANKLHSLKKKEMLLREEQAKGKAREVGAMKLEEVLREKREEKHKEAAALKAEQDRVRRQQQYLGAAAGIVEETREEQLLLGQERILKTQQSREKHAAVLREEARVGDISNRVTQKKREKHSKDALDLELERAVVEEKRRAVEKMKEMVVYKKAQARTGRAQHEVTRQVLTEKNPYAASISMESISKARTMKTHSNHERTASASNLLRSGIAFS